MKKLTLLLLSLLLVAGMTGCSNSSDGGSDGGSDSENTTITIWHTFTEHQEEVLEAFADEYEAAHEGVTIQVIGGYDTNSFESTVQDAVSNGVGPNLVFNDASLAQAFDGYDLLVAFDDYWDFDYSEVTTPALYERASGFSDGKVHAAPIQITGPVLFYNKAYYDQCGLDAPVTWDDVKAASQKIYEELGVVGLGVDSLPDIAQVLLLQSHDGNYVDYDNKTVLWDDEETVKWVEWWSEGVQNGWFQLAPTTGDYNSSDFNAGVVAAYVGSSAGLPFLDLSAIDGEIGVVRMPIIDENSTEVVGWNRAAVAFKSTEAQDRLAADFVAYFIEQDLRWVEVLNAYTPYYAVQEDPAYKEYVEGNLALEALGAQIDDSYVLPTFDGSLQVRDELKKLFSGCADPNFDAATAVAEAVAASNAAMNE